MVAQTAGRAQAEEDIYLLRGGLGLGLGWGQWQRCSARWNTPSLASVTALGAYNRYIMPQISTKLSIILHCHLLR